MAKQAQDRVHVDDLHKALQRVARDTSTRLVSCKRDGDSPIYILTTEPTEPRMEYR